MKDERTKAEKLAFTLDWLVANGHVPGIMPKDVTAAAELLRDQEAELKTLRTAMAAKDHTVEATAELDYYQTTIRAAFIITDPRIYYGEIRIDDRLAATHRDYLEHVMRQLVSVGTADWIQDLRERTYVAVHDALAKLTAAQGTEAQRATTVKQGVVHDGPVA